MMRAMTLMTVMVVLLAAAATADTNDGKPLHQVSPEDARIIAAISTWTQLSFVTTTTTVLYTCNRAIQSTLACKKRRLRKYSNLQNFEVQSDVSGLDGSFSEATKESRDTDPSAHGLAGSPSSTQTFATYFGKKDDDSNKPKGKLAITVWSSLTSTYTMSMTSINSATTFSVSFLCSVVGASFPPACG